MLIRLSDSELDYVFRLLTLRPFGEVEPLIASLREQVQTAQAGRQQGRGNGYVPNDKAPSDDAEGASLGATG